MSLFRSVDKKLYISGAGEFSIRCPESLNEGHHDIKVGTSLEFAQINGNSYGWYISDYPILRRKTERGIYTEDYEQLCEILETSSFWQGEIKDED